MFWIILLVVLVVIGFAGGFKNTGERYSAGRGFFRNSEYDLPENTKDDFNDYEPWNHDKMLK